MGLGLVVVVVAAVGVGDGAEAGAGAGAEAAGGCVSGVGDGATAAGPVGGAALLLLQLSSFVIVSAGAGAALPSSVASAVGGGASMGAGACGSSISPFLARLYLCKILRVGLLACAAESFLGPVGRKRSSHSSQQDEAVRRPAGGSGACVNQNC